MYIMRKCRQGTNLNTLRETINMNIYNSAIGYLTSLPIEYGWVRVPTTISTVFRTIYTLYGVI